MRKRRKTPVVLYVEDEESDRLFMQMAFSETGMAEALRTVNDGREAINYLAGKGVYADRKQYPIPSVVLLDLNLPVYHGFDVLKWMKESAVLRRLPVVVFTSSSRKEDRARAAALGASEFLEKPQSALKLGAVVERLRNRWLN